MAGKKQRKSKERLLGSHQKCWIWGRHVVLETLRAGRWQVLELRLADGLPSDSLESACRLAQGLDVPVHIDSSDRLACLCHSDDHQGYVAKMTRYPYESVDNILANRGNVPLYAILDCIQDPHNFGAIVRSAEVMGIDAVFVPRTSQVKVTSAVARSSAGAVNRVPIAEADDLLEVIRRLQGLGIEIVATSPTAKTSLLQHDFCKSTAIVVGNETVGVRADLSQICDRHVRIPQSGQIDSLNAAVSAGILFYEARRQRHAASAPRKS